MSEQEQELQIKEEYLRFLDVVKEDGKINMFGAAPYLQEVYDLTGKEARDVLMHWIKTFGDRHPGA